MKKIIIPSVILAAATIITAFVHDPIAPIAIGTSLPSATVKMKTTAGKEITLTDCKKENGLLVVFSCNTCPFVIKQESSILEMGKLTKDNKIGYVVVNSNESQRNTADSPDEMKAYAEKQGFTFPYTIDANSTLADAFGATRTPEAFLFDKNLKLVYHGAFTDDTDPKISKVFYVKDAVAAVGSGKEITVNNTKSVGCSIKRVVKTQD